MRGHINLARRPGDARPPRGRGRGRDGRRGARRTGSGWRARPRRLHPSATPSSPTCPPRPLGRRSETLIEGALAHHAGRRLRGLASDRPPRGAGTPCLAVTRRRSEADARSIGAGSSATRRRTGSSSSPLAFVDSRGRPRARRPRGRPGRAAAAGLALRPGVAKPAPVTRGRCCGRPSGSRQTRSRCDDQGNNRGVNRDVAGPAPRTMPASPPGPLKSSASGRCAGRR